MPERRSIIVMGVLVGVLIVGAVAAFFLYPRSQPDTQLNVGGSSVGQVDGIVTYAGIECTDIKTYKVPPCEGVYAEVTVHIHKEGSLKEVGSFKTDKKGIFSLRLPSGGYVAFVEKRDRPSEMFSQDFEVAEGRPTALVIRVPGDRT